MKIKSILLFLLMSLGVSSFAQIIIIGHDELNNYPLYNIRLTVVESNKIEQSLNTEKKPGFKITLNFGKKYKVYVQHPDCPVMFFEVDASNVPIEKQTIKMVHELDLPFFYKNDEDVDTTVFVKPVQKVYFDGTSKMISDTSYINQFYKGIIKPQKNEQPLLSENANIALPATIASQVLLNNDPKLSVKKQTITVFNSEGKVLRTTQTDRFGNFVITNIIPSQISKIQLIVTDGRINNSSQVFLNNSAQKFSSKTTFNNNKAEWVLSNRDRNKMVNNGFTSNIGGKLIHVTKGKKSFFANRTVYLSNKRNTIIKKTKTNSLGSFAFDEIKPDQTYFVGVDASELQKNEKIDVINKDDQLASTLDTIAANRISTTINSSNNPKFNSLTLSESEMRMSVNAKLYGDNTSNPLGKIKVLLLNDAYEVIDSTVTDDLGLFKFKYLPYLKRFYLSAENDKSQLDVFSSILMYSNDDNLVKVLTHVKGAKFIYKPLASEINKIREVEMEDPWLELGLNKKSKNENKIIIEPILFETNKFNLLDAAIETLDKITSILQANTTIKVEIGAHTDSKGNDQENLKLSEMRAKAVIDYLEKNGISPSRLTSKGYGETKILNRCANGVECSELEHAVNRRVEFKILSK